MNKLIYLFEKVVICFDEKVLKLFKLLNENVYVVVIYVFLRKINVDWYGDKFFDWLLWSN